MGAYGDPTDPIQPPDDSGVALATTLVAADPEPATKIVAALATAVYLILHSPEATYVPPPKTLPAFPGAKRVPPKTPVPGVPGKKRARWEDDEYIYEWDYLHGRVEKWSKNGRRHLGEFDHLTGEQTKPGDPSRKPIDP